MFISARVRTLSLMIFAFGVWGTLFVSCNAEEKNGHTVLTQEIVDAYVVRAAVCFGSPEITEGLERFNFYTLNEQLTANDSALFSCIAAANDCYELFTCYGMDPDRIPCGSGDEAHCEGNTRVECAMLPNMESVEFRYDCRDGETCVETTNEATEAETTCSTGTCNADGYSCDGETLVYCSQGIERRADCRYHPGFTCRETALYGETRSRCWFADDICTAADAEDKCYGENISIDCGSKENPIWITDCSLYFPGAVCGTACYDLPFVDGGAEECMSDCTLPGSDEGLGGKMSCDGDVAMWCVGDVCHAYDCGSFGDATCVVTDENYVTCQSPSWAAVL